MGENSKREVNMYSLKPGTQILYVPMHARGNENHPDVEEGFVTSHKGDVVFCRYWSKRHPDELRTKANSERTPLWYVKLKDTRPQCMIDALLLRMTL
jgi:hypothetical protein